MSKAKIAVIGAGLMGHGIAQVFALAGHEVTVSDTVMKNLDTLEARIAANLRDLGEDESAVTRVRPCVDLREAVRGVDYVVEAVYEDLALKQKLFAEIEAHVRTDTILATNTSVIPITAIMGGLKRRERALGTHWWNPPFLVPLVEVIETQWTSPDAVAWTMDLHRVAGKQPAHVKKDVPGFIGNRLQHALWREAIALVEQGICDAETVDAVIKASFGRRLAVLGPLENADLVGTDLALAVHNVVLPAIDSRPGPSPYLQKLVADGKLGFKSGEGFRKWSQEEQATLRARLVAHLKASRDQEKVKMTGETKNLRPFTTIDRRAVVARGLGMLAAPVVLRAIPAKAQSKIIKIGHVSPRTGPLAGFGEADGFILDQVRSILAKGLENGGKTYQVELVSKDSQSSGTRASEVASELILRDKVDLIVASATPDTTNPVADQAEVNEVPCITTNCPWQPYFFGRNGDPKKGFTWTYHFFWGLEDVIAAFLALWEGQVSNGTVGGLFPNDADGNAWGDPQRGLPPALAKAGYRLIDPGRYQVMNNDFTSQITRFKEARVTIVTGNMIPPDFATFWSQAAQQNFHPAIVTIGKALLFPSVVNSLGPRGNGLSSEIWWTPNYPFRSGLTGQSAQQLTDAYTSNTRRPWSQPIGYQHALFEVAIDVLKRAKSIEPKSILDAIVATNYNSIVGLVHWTGQPVKNVSKTPLVAGQWQRRGGAFELVITANKPAPEIPVGGKLELLS